MENRQLVSIGVPVYNGEKYLRECLYCLVNQSYSNLEIIISNNCSTDFTESICLDFAEADIRIKYFQQNDLLEPMRNFQFVLEKSSGDYFMWAACDDLWKSSFVSECLELFRIDESLIAVNGRCLFAGNKDLYSGDSGFHQTFSFFRKFNYLWNPGPNARFYSLYRSKILKNFNIHYYSFFAGDWALYLDILDYGKTKKLDSDYSFFKRADSNSNSSLIKIKSFLKVSGTPKFFPLSNLVTHIWKADRFFLVFYIFPIIYQNFICLKWLYFSSDKVNNGK